MTTKSTSAESGLSVEAVYRSHGHVVFRRARQILGNDDDARELLQELFAGLLEKPEQFGGRSSVTTWLYSATTHLALNRLRNARNRTRLLAVHATPAERSAPPHAEHRALAQDVLSKLPVEEATATVYFIFDGLTHEEIAGIMKCSRRHVGHLLERAQTAVEGKTS